MFSNSKVLGSLAGLGLLFSGAAAAQMPVERPALETQVSDKFRRIEQPLEFKVSVTLAGLALIGLELWWFLRK